jgi:Type II secretion system (T2SS), protein E, N-terminal domain
VSLFSKTEERDAVAHDSSEFHRKPLGALLVDAGLIDDGQLAEALHEGTQTGERLGEVVVSRGWATEDDVARLLAEQWDLEYVERASIWFDADALGRLSREDAQRLEALPVRVEGDRVMVAVAEPTEQRLADLRRLTGEDTVVVVVPKTALDAGIRSELLTSRGPSTEEPTMNEEATPDDGWYEDQAPEETVSDDTPVLHAVPSEEAGSGAQTAPSNGSGDLNNLAARAREIADFIAGHAAVIRDYERRIEELEAELAKNRATTAEAKTQLAAVLQLVDVLKPSV